MSSFFKASKKAEDLKTGGNHITSSGIYPVSILAPMVSVSRNGSTTIDFYVEHNGQKQSIYGNLRITNNDDTPNKIGAKVFNQLVIIAGLDDLAEPVEHDLPVGKKEAMKPVAVLEDLCDVDVMMRIQMEYGSYKGNITERKVIKAFFRAEDNASAEEIVNGTTPGAAFEREQKYVDHITYKDGVTAEQVATWVAAGRPDGSGAAATETPNFGTRRSGFGKKKEA